MNSRWVSVGWLLSGPANKPIRPGSMPFSLVRLIVGRILRRSSDAGSSIRSSPPRPFPHDRVMVIRLPSVAGVRPGLLGPPCLKRRVTVPDGRYSLERRRVTAEWRGLRQGDAMRSNDRAMRKRIKLHASILVGSVAAVLIVIELAIGFSQLVVGLDAAVDYQIYTDATTRWLSDGSYFLPRQLAGPYQLQMGDVFYPPVALWLFVPFTVLPAVLWWAVPIAITAAALERLRPPSWTIAVSLVVFLCPKYLEFVFDGNP